MTQATWYQFIDISIKIHYQYKNVSYQVHVKYIHVYKWYLYTVGYKNMADIFTCNSRLILTNFYNYYIVAD